LSELIELVELAHALFGESDLIHGETQRG
jgi:hypothetical protein